MMNNHEKSLPVGYKEVFHIDARNKKTGLIFNLLAFIPLIIMGFIFAFTMESILFIEATDEPFKDLLFFFLKMLGILLSIVLYMVLHELVHGIAYKSLTKEKLTFGLSWSCAFCGVPDAYVYRKTAIVALISPFVVFTLLFLPLTVVFFFVNEYLYLLFGILLAMHLGGCSGDIYMYFLLKCKYKDARLLMRDSGPEQWLYLPA